MFSSLTWLKLLVPLKPTFPKMQLKAPFVRPRLLNVWASHSNFLAFKLKMKMFQINMWLICFSILFLFLLLFIHE